MNALTYKQKQGQINDVLDLMINAEYQQKHLYVLLDQDSNIIQYPVYCTHRQARSYNDKLNGSASWEQVVFSS